MSYKIKYALFFFFSPLPTWTAPVHETRIRQVISSEFESDLADGPARCCRHFPVECQSVPCVQQPEAFFL